MLSENRDVFSKLRLFQPVPWSQIPDLGLYMDQVITLIGRTFQPIYGEDTRAFLSASMINNYVKAKLIPRPTGKKYSRDQIALLSMIVILKQVCSMDDIRQLLTLREGQSVEELYGTFCQRFDRIIQSLDAETDRGLDLAMDLAIRAAGYRVGCDAALKADSAE